MQALRQLGTGVIIAILSVLLVLGGIFLSLAETLPAPETPTQIPSTLPPSFPTPTAGGTQTPVLPIETFTSTASASPTATMLQPTLVVCNPPSGWIQVTISGADTIYSLAQRYKTTAESLSAANCLSSLDVPAGFALYVPPVPTVTVIPCGPPAGWVRARIVQRGDTLYSIALSYNLSFQQLQRANCMGSSTTIYAGQRLWVPNIPPIPARTVTPGITVVPNFPTETDSATTPPPPNTATIEPTATTIPPTTPPVETTAAPSVQTP